MVAVTKHDPRSRVAALGAERVVESFVELLADDSLDVVHICVPNALHAELAAAALDTGRAVICEKPLATTVAEASALTDRARAAGVVNAVPFVYRYHPVVRLARDRIDAGHAGALRILHGSYLQDWLSRSRDSDWRIDAARGGASRAFGDIGIHWCDLMEFVTGHRITRLVANLKTAVPERPDIATVTTEDMATIMFETDRGAAGSLVLSQVSPGRKNRLWFSFDGEHESLAFDQECPEQLWVGTRDDVRLLSRGVPAGSTEADRLSVLPPGHPQGYQDAFTAFVADAYAALLGGSPEGRPTFADGLRAAVLTEAVLRSTREASWVDVPPVSVAHHRPTK
ncbi:oxidoreductase [Actinotalea fermentans ATCC 43279 = JCM 9966 = DSM 3133]|uniref:Dehydrogenase n=1 Tax=Actinotalea fermentans TaxID=43671 RepID=A0A511YZN0_9CELL|nr:oxidoreductase [Actinotalea fermentans ATCC 43279 = JCM 9966 = DSM 3133]GEN80642.1 dehydrogenase [Actinotalea fermentans]